MSGRELRRGTCRILVACWATVGAAAASDNSFADRAGGSGARVQGESPLKPIYFPPDPPPLGARINFDAQRLRPSLAPVELAAQVAEPFYAPLSTLLVDGRDSIRLKFQARVDAHTRARDALLKDLREALARAAGALPDVRLAGLSALAQRQAEALARLDAEAETLRRDLARRASWYAVREWKLGRASLSERRPEHRVLEYQLVRAAAYYQEGLSPAQRRLLREAAMFMQDQMFSDNNGSPPLVFFSPDLTRLLPQGNRPAAMVSMLDSFAQEKDALRRELVVAVIDHDRAMFPRTRERALEELARAQAPRLTALNEKADAIRREYAPTFARLRRVTPPPLPDDVAGLIESYLNGSRLLREELERRRIDLANRIRSTSAGQTVGEIRAKIAEAAHALEKDYLIQHAAEIEVLEKVLDQVHPRLVALAGPDDPPEGSSRAVFLLDFLRQRRENASLCEYEIAVWEPGLSPAQRRLLLGGAMVQLGMPLPDAEYQPGRLPAMLLDRPGG